MEALEGLYSQCNAGYELQRVGCGDLFNIPVTLLRFIRTGR
jgi:hypothetical protein